MFWVIIEMLRNEENYKLPLDKNTYRAIKTLTNTNINIEEYIKNCIEDYRLFVKEDKNFYSKSLLDRMLEYEKKKAKNQENGKLGGRPKKTQEKPNGLEYETEKNQNKGKENKVKENKIKEIKIKEKIHFAEFVSMTNAEYEKLVSTYGKDFADQCIIILDNYKGSHGKNYKSDYRAILSWVVDKANENNSKKQNKKNGIDDFKELWKEAQNEQTGNNPSNNFTSW